MSHFFAKLQLFSIQKLLRIFVKIGRTVGSFEILQMSFFKWSLLVKSIAIFFHHESFRLIALFLGSRDNSDQLKFQKVGKSRLGWKSEMDPKWEFNANQFVDFNNIDDQEDNADEFFDFNMETGER